jgi:hypothetical protein
MGNEEKAEISSFEARLVAKRDVFLKRLETAASSVEQALAMVEQAKANYNSVSGAIQAINEMLADAKPPRPASPGK